MLHPPVSLHRHPFSLLIPRKHDQITDVRQLLVSFPVKGAGAGAGAGASLGARTVVLAVVFFDWPVSVMPIVLLLTFTSYDASDIR